MKRDFLYVKSRVLGGLLPLAKPLNTRGAVVLCRLPRSHLLPLELEAFAVAFVNHIKDLLANQRAVSHRQFETGLVTAGRERRHRSGSRGGRVVSRVSLVPRTGDGARCRWLLGFARGGTRAAGHSRRGRADPFFGVRFREHERHRAVDKCRNPLVRLADRRCGSDAS